MDLTQDLLKVFYDLQLNAAKNPLDTHEEAMRNEKGKNTNLQEGVHRWGSVEDGGGFTGFLHLYRTHFGEWYVDKGLIRGVVQLFLNRHIQVWSDGQRDMDLENLGIGILPESGASEEQHERQI